MNRCYTRAVILLSTLVLLALSGFMTGCSTMQAGEEHINIDLGSQPTVYRDQWARRNPPQVYVRPQEMSGANPTALFVPFRVTQPISNPEMVGYSQARIFWQTWLSMQLFPAMEFDAAAGPFRRDKALALARGKGADLLIGGFVTYYYPGGTSGDSQVAVQLEIYDTASGQLVWSMAQSALMPAATTNDYLILAVKTRLPTDPMYALAKTMAQDMGLIIRSTMSPSGPGTRAQQADEAMVRALRGNDPSAAPAAPARRETPSF